MNIHRPPVFHVWGVPHLAQIRAAELEHARHPDTLDPGLEYHKLTLHMDFVQLEPVTRNRLDQLETMQDAIDGIGHGNPGFVGGTCCQSF